ncbi:conserved hypothetical protein [Vibrio cholerae O1 str. 2010EL-1786]|uniref:Uncharacterized protein n=2 Tax=Vibrio cholerae TaxID=666 RepID=A0A0X1L246_VIBCO|nr:hypothetical protein VC0395_1099 [Vibrio cholerae O395]AET29390.1 conserved hypothetical protein [Vibrio cholerae O1 str. 2010EL-1786]AFC59683.1 hypothetical protein O3Y_14303 [Vibrio cholerae IEC224]APF50477.1 hypothetical protein ASZ80_02981 [Vibrio cholerae]EAZ75200.1 hypothetical protein A5C_A0222 [Vibrio cholerae NCTC 8457]EAZ76310.1 hypothetical protein A5E_A0210 [Vibrio cholerae B33]EET24565.1 conserved hypothetical protein [Vibrio cholerae MO10]EMB00839.1 Hypothetical protein B839
MLLIEWNTYHKVAFFYRLVEKQAGIKVRSSLALMQFDYSE